MRGQATRQIMRLGAADLFGHGSGQQPARSCFTADNVGEWQGGERSGAERKVPERSPDASALPPRTEKGRVGGLESDVACDREAIERRSKIVERLMSILFSHEGRLVQRPSTLGDKICRVIGHLDESR